MFSLFVFPKYESKFESQYSQEMLCLKPKQTTLVSDSTKNI